MKILNINEVRGRKIQLSNYTHIRAYHACRAENEDIFRTQGLKPYTKDEALAVAIRKLENQRTSKEAIEAKFHELWEERISARVWLMPETTELLSTSGHYLIYGSEFINALAMHLGCRERLKEIGTPMIITCNVPIADMSPCWLSELEQDIKSGNTANRSIAVNKIVPENICDIIYPTGYIRDPYLCSFFKLG